jgi:hypothetical protein
MKVTVAFTLALSLHLAACTSHTSDSMEKDAALFALSSCNASDVPAPITRNGYPHLAGMNIGAKNYDDACYQANLARLDIVILGFYKGWHGGTEAIQSAVQGIKTLNPNILVGQYTILTEQYDHENPATDDIRAKLDTMDWWLYTAAGNKVQWTTAYRAWEVNVTEATSTDSDGYRFPQWFARWSHETFFSDIPEFDIWYFDNVFPGPRVTADYNLDHADDSPDDAAVKQAYRSGVAAEWTSARSLGPGLTCLGNVTDLSSVEYSKNLDGGFCEALMGEYWSLESWGGWTAMMENYRGIKANVKNSGLVIFNVHGASTNYRLMRYGLASCLLENGYFAYTDIRAGYSSVPWFDEYNISLGQPVDSPPTAAWQNGVYRRRFDNGMAIVNPKGNGSATVTVEAGYRRISGTQDPVTNSGQEATTITLKERDGIILLKI